MPIVPMPVVSMRFGTQTRQIKAKPKLTEAQRLEVEHEQLIRAEKLYYGLLDMIVAKDGPKAKQQEIDQWLTDHEVRRNELHTLLNTPKALPKANRDIQYVLTIMPLQAKLATLQRSPQMTQAYNRLSASHKFIYDSCWLETEDTLKALSKTPRKLKAALISLIGRYTQGFQEGVLDNELKAFLTDWNRDFKPKKRQR